MHELSITQAILDTALRAAAQSEARKICGLHVRLGALSGVVADSVQFYFEFVSKDTLAEGAQLTIETSALHARCRACGGEVELPSGDHLSGEWMAHFQALPACTCGQSNYELAGGFDCLLESIDVE